ncbi:MAG: hypothetical protein ABI596_08975 [Pyrinomonadaceae bacterium]
MPLHKRSYDPYHAFLRARRGQPLRSKSGIAGKPYGDFPFTVKAGKIQLQGRQVREHTPPMDLIIDHLSGGRYTSWWIKREKPAVK